MRTASKLFIIFLIIAFTSSCQKPSEKIQGNWNLESTEVTGGSSSDAAMVDMMKQIYTEMNGQVWSFTQAEYKLGWANTGGAWYMDEDNMIISLKGEYGEQKMKVEEVNSEKLILSSENDGIKITHYLHKQK